MSESDDFSNRTAPVMSSTMMTCFADVSKARAGESDTTKATDSATKIAAEIRIPRCRTRIRKYLFIQKILLAPRNEYRTLAL